ncbi:MAG: lytic transglycosylase [Betaproteobacteria bacterium]|nr:MAG: lytic transglycosylase [Betaproteobacteria bacterium]
MFLRHLLTIALAFAVLGPGAACAAPKKPAPDDALLAAYDAFRAGDVFKLQKQAAQLEGHLLEPYVDYWRLRLELENAAPPEVNGFLSRYQGSYLAERLRGEWLRELGRRGEWAAFDLELASFLSENLEIRCYAWSARLARADDGAYEEAQAMWREPKELPAGCAMLAETMIAVGRLDSAQIWDRVRLLLEHGQVAAAKRALGYLPGAEAPDERLLQQAASAPQRVLAHPPSSLESRAAREMLRFAFVRLARTDPRPAAEVLMGPLGLRLGDAERKSLWGRIAYEAARRHLAEAVAWYRLAGDAELSDEQLAWKARAALRAADWEMVRAAIDPLSVTARQDPAWTYWYGRALAAQGSAEGARAYYLRISGQPHFYGLLAAEELGEAIAVPQPMHVAGEDEVALARRNPGLARALELYRLGLRSEATREWNFTIRGMDDPQLLAAAELARRAEVFDRAINTADRTARQHNFQVRFLAPFRDVFREQARAFDLEEAWVLGLVRQESRFIADARSSAGARGLMQLMPATASWMARRIGMSLSPQRVAEVGTNVTLGTGYLKYVLESLGHPVLASAAYNAGPGRARRWRDAKPLEGAIYAETIPFNETRDYVKKVMANTMFYAMLHGGRHTPLKQRLGTIAPGERAADERS